MITVNNYSQQIKPFLSQLTPGQKEVHTQIEAGALEFYDDPEIKETIDLYLDRLNKTHFATKKEKSAVKVSTKKNAERAVKAVKKAEPSTTPTPVKTTKKRGTSTKKVSGKAPRKNTKPKKEKSRVASPVYDGKYVEMISSEVEFARKYVHVHGKLKTRKQLSNLLTALKRAITLRKITRLSHFADEMRKMQSGLVKACNELKRDDSTITIHINEADLARYVAMAGGEKVYGSINFLKQYIRMQGHMPEISKVKAFVERVNKAGISDSDPYEPQIKQMLHHLGRYVEGKEGNITIESAQLNGLQGILSGIDGCLCQLQGLGERAAEQAELAKQTEAFTKGIMSLSEARNFTVKPFLLAEPYQSLIGGYYKGANILVYGRKGQGKTTFLLPFAAYLANHFGRTAYVSGEQYASGPFSALIKRLGIQSDKLDIVAELDKISPENYQFIFLDSKEALRLSLDDFKALKKAHPLVNFLVISQVNKEGEVRGTEEWGHEVDALIRVSEGKASTEGEKNRMGGSATIAIDFH